MTLEELLKRPEKKKVGTREETTVAAIRDNFLHLLRRNPIEKISVAELCERCNINRSTFYRHYSDLYALLDSIVEEAHDALFYDVIEQVDFHDDFEQMGYRYILKVCDATEKNKELYKLLLFGKSPTSLRERMTESAYQLYDLAHEGPTNLKPSEEVPLHYRFLVNGMIGVWVSWVHADCKPAKETIANVVQKQISGFYGTMWNLYGKQPEE